MPLTVSSVDSTELRIDQQQLSELKCMEERKECKTNKHRKEHLRTVRQYQRYNIHIIRIPKGEEKENRLKEIFEVIMSTNFPKLTTDTNL